MATRELYVVKLVSDSELLLNVGKGDDVVLDEVFEILDPNTQDVLDPKTGMSLGSVDRVLARVALTEISDKMSLARITPRRALVGLSGVSQVLSGGSGSITLNPARWPEGVEATFPVRSTGKVLKKT